MKPSPDWHCIVAIVSSRMIHTKYPFKRILIIPDRGQQGANLNDPQRPTFIADGQCLQCTPVMSRRLSHDETPDINIVACVVILQEHTTGGV